MITGVLTQNETDYKDNWLLGRVSYLNILAPLFFDEIQKIYPVDSVRDALHFTMFEGKERSCH